jgi:hypothetical protein
MGSISPGPYQLIRMNVGYGVTGTNYDCNYVSNREYCISPAKRAKRVKYLVTAN